LKTPSQQINNAGTPFLTDGYPYDDRHRQLKSVELVARGLDHFGTYDLKILTDLKLPSWTEPKKLSWPIPKPPVDWSGVVPAFVHREQTGRASANEAQHSCAGGCSKSSPVFTQLRTCRCAAITDAMCHFRIGTAKGVSTNISRSRSGACCTND